jgi:prepilin-type N-terminal cleavage/methylation domain-containing protein
LSSRKISISGGPVTGGRRARRRGERGFTLVELAVATVLLVVGILALAHVALTIQQMKRADDERAMAASVLLDQLRSIETTPFGDVVANFDGHAFDVVLPGETNVALRAVPGDTDGRVGLVSVIAPTPPNDPTELLEATVRLDWDGAFGRVHLERHVRISRPGANP